MVLSNAALPVGICIPHRGRTRKFRHGARWLPIKAESARVDAPAFRVVGVSLVNEAAGERKFLVGRLRVLKDAALTGVTVTEQLENEIEGIPVKVMSRLMTSPT